MKIIRKLIDNRFTRRIRPSIDRFAMQHRILICFYNYLSNRLPALANEALWSQSAKSAVGHKIQFGADTWCVDDGLVKFKLRLRNEHAALDWDSGISALGHDVEIKEFYRRIIKNARAMNEPLTFLDAGANFGYHSAYFAAAGSTVFSFEPNPTCAANFAFLAALNGWSTQWVSCGLGDTEGMLTLAFPVGEEWLGTFVNNSTQHPGWCQIAVPVKTLDSFEIKPKGQTLLKIDTEGYELSVILGARKTIANFCTHVLFESLIGDRNRAEIEVVFKSLDMLIRTISKDGQLGDVLSNQAFAKSNQTNFCATKNQRL